jgi:NADPH:quinone reductase-like Zn-dependent oxidoreductase
VINSKEIIRKLMRAIVYTEFGPPDVLQLKEVEKPSPKKSKVLIKIYAAVVAKEDPEMRATPGIPVPHAEYRR